MAGRDYDKDFRELPIFAKQYCNKPTLECIEAYAKKRKIVSHRAGKVFWELVDCGSIVVYAANGIFYVSPRDGQISEEGNQVKAITGD